MDKILRSLKIKNTLNPKLWDGNILKKDITDRLVRISEEFVEYLGVDVFIDDILLTGSLVNYNWSDYSDVDLHILISYEQYPSDDIGLYKELFRLKKMLFNLTHDIKIYDYDVELYIQDINESHYSSGVYSVMFGEWRVTPKKDKIKGKINDDVLKTKIKSWMDLIDELIETNKTQPVENLDLVEDRIMKLKDKLKKYRSEGLESSGEFSYENLTFKALRRSGYIEKLFNFKTNFLDKKLSLK